LCAADLVAWPPIPRERGTIAGQRGMQGGMVGDLLDGVGERVRTRGAYLHRAG
jgi:hypothetical protein